MPPPIAYRIAGSAVSLSLQVVNSCIMLAALRDDVIMQDPEVRTMASMMMRFITVWNVSFHLMYFSLALVCDVLTVADKDDLLPKNIKKIRDFFFSAIVFPGTFLVFTMFWPIFIYDRELIYPAFIDKAFYPISSYVIHMAIVPSVLWELAFQPKETPMSHTLHVTAGALYYLVYNSFIYYTYFKRGIWPYNLMGVLYHGPPIYNIMFHLFSSLIFLSYYFLQWRMKAYFWGKGSLKKKL